MLQQEGLIGLRWELVRKTLHMICMLAILLLLNLFSTWYQSVLTVLIFAFIAYPILALFERFPLYKKFLAERRSGEVKNSLLLVSLMVILLTTVFWGGLGTSWKYIIVVAVMAWGYGDAAAALVGKAFGRHFIQHRLIEGKKTVEGLLAMFAVSWLAVFISLLVYTTMPWYLCLVIALLVAPVCAVVELFSLRGTDTITVPLSAAAATFAVVSFFTLMGV